MFCMGQDQSKGVELEDKVVESQILRRYEDRDCPANLY